jgi:type IV secretion system protein VirB9
MKNYFSRITHYYHHLAAACLALLAVSSLIAQPAYALRDSRPLAVDPRIRVIVYNPDDVFKYTGFYGYQSSIEFEEGESVESMSMGDSLSWQMVPAGRRLFLKPMEPDATTNMTLLTNKRMYQFELHAAEATDINDPKLVFSVRFLYPDSNNTNTIQQYSSSFGPDLSQPEKYNFNYTISGSNSVAPIKIFDDGEFTYFQFKDKNEEVPAFFLVDADGKEALVNYHVVGEYIAVERVSSQFTLRNGSEVVCVFNEKRPLEKKKKKK